ncbi:MAG: cell division protein FtsL [Burkholderiales bacterium]|nr:cell division protein FtsL [Burkholderiales bacterium]MDE1928121.1 cell division protein FtsL [Burkholderiales bacterium]MDE2158581.1 cell division protein FtsL [Burkholderiales bacterium]MDE2504531.1 cell division protein FtsL [Burkholderiales bacterium]
MMRLNALLLLGLVASSLLLVRTAYESRRIYAELDQARGEQGKLDAEYKRLEAEAQAQGTNMRVDRVARAQLKMAPPLRTEIVDDPAAAAAAAAAGAAP